MRILLDECIDESLRHHVSQHDCQTCRFAGFKGLANGKLIAAAANAGFDVIITVDQKFTESAEPFRSSLSLVVLRTRTTNIDDLVALMPRVHEVLRNVARGQFIQVEEDGC
jgi:predicted nuclease of predicted toxin-antitoxin system